MRWVRGGCGLVLRDEVLGKGVVWAALGASG